MIWRSEPLLAYPFCGTVNIRCCATGGICGDRAGQLWMCWDLCNRQMYEAQRGLWQQQKKQQHLLVARSGAPVQSSRSPTCIGWANNQFSNLCLNNLQTINDCLTAHVVVSCVSNELLKGRLLKCCFRPPYETWSPMKQRRHSNNSLEAKTNTRTIHLKQRRTLEQFTWRKDEHSNLKQRRTLELRIGRSSSVSRLSKRGSLKWW